MGTTSSVLDKMVDNISVCVCGTGWCYLESNRREIVSRLITFSIFNCYAQLIDHSVHLKNYYLRQIKNILNVNCSNSHIYLTGKKKRMVP